MSLPSASANIARRLTERARQTPDRAAVMQPIRPGSRKYRQLTFRELDDRSDALAAGLRQRGLAEGSRLVLFVPFSIEFITLTFALFKAGAVIVLIDPGMGRRNIFRCLGEVRPEGFVAIPRVHLIRWLAGRKFRQATFNISVGRKLPGVIATEAELAATAAQGFLAFEARANDPAAVIFTSGSTGPPKGVLYEHGMFDAQVDMIQQYYGIEPGEIDLPGFPLFGLFNAAMGVTTVIPDMDPTRPAEVDPVRIIQAIADEQVTQAFGSPAFWNRVGRWCEEHDQTLPSFKRALSAGGPVPPHVLQRMAKVLTRPGADLFTPYGATEALPVASIGGKQVLQETAELTRQGAGTCVGSPFPGVKIRIVRMADGPLSDISQAEELAPGEIGEILVQSPSVTREYYQRPEATALAKVPDGEGFWHRMGDVGYLDSAGRLWFCGRKAHVVETSAGRMFSVCCEAIFDEHPDIYRSALVGVGKRPAQRPVLIAEPEPGKFPRNRQQRGELIEQLLARGAAHELTRDIRDVLLHRSLPVDTRHNVKINREALAVWAAGRMR